MRLLRGGWTPWDDQSVWKRSVVVASGDMADDVSKVQLVRLRGVPRTHLSQLRLHIPCHDPVGIARFWAVMLGSEPEDILGNGVWFIGATIGRSAASFDFHLAPDEVTDLTRLHLDVITEDRETTTQLALERGGQVEHEIRNHSGQVVWRSVIDMEGNSAGLVQREDIDAWWHQDDEGKPWPRAGTAKHYYLDEA
jgi:Glyoxalase-like domain